MLTHSDVAGGPEGANLERVAVPRGGLVGTAAVLLLCGAVLGACSFDAGVGSRSCQKEGATSDGKICRDGTWVSIDALSSADGTSRVDAGEAGVVQFGHDGGSGDKQCQPSKERCNGTDDDCDGVKDENCPCNYRGKNEGVCSGSKRAESGGCKPPSGYRADEGNGDCDGADNDCDGTTDEGCPCNYDGKSAGVCANGRLDSSGACTQPGSYEKTESSCDTKDNDCDGQTDGDDSGLQCNCTPGATGSCYSGPAGTSTNGICSPGTKKCRSNGTWGPCNNQKTPASEGGGANCDGKDNDCDGTTDEGCGGAPCSYKGKTSGVCSNQTTTTSGSCKKPGAYEKTEVSCSDGKDNDCDGATDEGTKGGGASCSSDCECHSGECAGSTCAHLLFVTQTTVSADFGGVAQAKKICKREAKAAGYGGGWEAILSGKSSAKSRISIHNQVRTAAGHKVADSGSDLFDGYLDHDVNYDAYGNGLGARWVWTGSDSSGGSAQDCKDWSSTDGRDRGRGGRSWRRAGWLSSGAYRCWHNASLYCIDGQ